MRSPRVIEKRKKIKSKWLWWLLRIVWYSEVWQFPMRWASLISQEPSTRVFDPSTSVKIKRAVPPEQRYPTLHFQLRSQQLKHSVMHDAARKQRASSAQHVQLATSCDAINPRSFPHSAATCSTAAWRVAEFGAAGFANVYHAFTKED